MTDRIEAQAEAIFDRIRGLGADGTMTAGILRGIEDGWFTGEIADAAFAYQRAVEKGDKQRRRRQRARPTPSSSRWRSCASPARSSEIQVRELAERRRPARDASRRLGRARCHRSRRPVRREPGRADARGGRAEATLGEICDVLRTVWGTYTETANF